MIGHYNKERDAMVGVFKSEKDDGSFVAMYQLVHKLDKIVFKFTSGFNSSENWTYETSDQTDLDRLNYFSTINKMIATPEKTLKSLDVIYDPISVD